MAPALLALLLGVKCATACYDLADRTECVYRVADKCEPHEAVCTPALKCATPVSRKVADVDVTLVELPEDRRGRPEMRLRVR